MPTAWATAREQSFIMIKPDGVHRGLVADIMKRFEARGYKLVGIKARLQPKAPVNQLLFLPNARFVTTTQPEDDSPLRLWSAL